MRTHLVHIPQSVFIMISMIRGTEWGGVQTSPHQCRCHMHMQQIFNLLLNATAARTQTYDNFLCGLRKRFFDSRAFSLMSCDLSPLCPTISRMMRYAMISRRSFHLPEKFPAHHVAKMVLAQFICITRYVTCSRCAYADCMHGQAKWRAHATCPQWRVYK